MSCSAEIRLREANGAGSSGRFSLSAAPGSVITDRARPPGGGLGAPRSPVLVSVAQGGEAAPTGSSAGADRP